MIWSKKHRRLSSTRGREEEKVQKKAVIDDPVKLDFDMVSDVVVRAAQAYPACMSTFNTCKFVRGGGF